MIINVTVGNPPYQESTGGGGYIETSIAIYDDFVNIGNNISNRCIMLIPARWLTGGQYKIDGFRYKIVTSKHVKQIKYYRNSRELFDNLSIAGGVLILDCDNKREYQKCLFGDREIDLSEYKYFDKKGSIQYMIAHDIIGYDIIKNIKHTCISDTMLPVNPFRPVNGKPTQNEKYIDKYKVCVSKVSADTGYVNGEDKYRVLYDTYIVGPGEFCGIEALVLACFDTVEEAANFEQYIQTKIVRYLIWITVSGMNLTFRNFMFVPKLDMNRKWSDNDLRELLSISDSSWSHIDRLIK